MNPADNLKEVQLLPNVQGKAGGAAIFYVAAKVGEPITWARLVRQNGEHKMFIIKRKVVRSKSFEGTMKWPTLTVETETDPVELLKAYPSEHVQAVLGNYASESANYAEF